MSSPRDNLEAKLGLTGPPLQGVRESPPTIPAHELLRRIGQGAYGEVWLARNALRTWRAVKIVYRDNFKDDRPYEREFAGIRRFEPLSRSNEGFVDVLQVGRNDAQGYFYYVMELADDWNAECRMENDESRAHTYTPLTLARDVAHRGRLPLEDCLQLGLTLTLALGHLHRHGLIHRDIKPSNIIYVGGVPKLADIGLVTEAQGANTFVGTEGFVPPEGPTSPRADLYALGKVLYEAAMGKDRNEFPEPFTQIGTDNESVALMELNAVLLRACTQDVKKRYGTAEEMHADLALLHSGGSVKRRHQFDRQFQIAKQVGAVAIAATLVIGGAWVWQQQQTQKMTRLAKEKSDLATEKTTLAENLAKLGEENRNRIVRLDIANGVRLLDEGDPADALLWFADALPLVANNRAEESIHRIRIQQTLNRTPRVLQVFPHESSLRTAAFSPDGRFIATGTRDGNLRVWSVTERALVWGPRWIAAHPSFLRFSRDGRRLFVSSSFELSHFSGTIWSRNFFAVLDAESGQDLFSANKLLSGPSTNLVCAHVSPDDRWVAAAGKDNLVRVFDLTNGSQITELRGHTDAVQFLSFSADGSLLASASLDRTVRLWRLPSGEPVGPPLEHRWPVVRVLLTDSGEHLISASFAKPGASDPDEDSESEVQAWDVANARRLGDPIATGKWVNMFIAPGSQGKFFVHGRAYDFDTPKEVRFSVNLPGLIQSWDFTKDGSRLVMGTSEYVARVFDARTGTPLTEPFRHTLSSTGAALFSPNGKLLITGSDDGNARLWDIRGSPSESSSRKLPAPMQQLRPGDWASGASRSPERTPLFMTDGSLRLFGENLQELHRFEKPQPGMRFLGITSGWQSNHWAMRQFEPDGKVIFLWHPEGTKTRGFRLEHPGEVKFHYFTRDDRFLVTYCGDRVVRFWRTSDGGLERTVALPSAAVESGIRDMSPDGKFAVWFQKTPIGLAIQFLDLESGMVTGEAHTFTGQVFESAFSPDGKRIAFLDDEGPVTVLESGTGRVITSTISHSSNLSWVEWHPDSHRLLTAGQDDQVLVWDAETGTQLLGPLRTPGSTVQVARWSPDGRFIITRSQDKNVRAWDGATGEAVTPRLKHEGEVAFAFMTRSNRVITASYPDQLRAWDLRETSLSSEILLDYAKLLSGHQLSASGTMLALKPEELAALNRSLLQRAPQLFE